MCPAPRPRGRRPSTGGARCPWPTCSSRRRTLARRGFKVDKTFNTADRRQRRAVQHLHLDPQAVPPTRQGTRRSAACSATPTSPTPTTCSRSGAWRAFYRGDLARELAKTVRKPPVSGRTDLPVPKGKHAGEGPREVRRHPAPAHPRRLPGAGRLRHAALLQRRDHGRRGAQHPRALRPEVDDAGAGAAPRDLEAAHLAFADRAKYVGDPERGPGLARSSPTRTPRSGRARSTRCTRSRRRPRRATSRRPTATAPPRAARARRAGHRGRQRPPT